MRSVLTVMLLSLPVFGQRQEVGFTLGGLRPANRTAVESKGGIGLQANYGIRLWGNDMVALFGEVHMLASPKREVTADRRALAATTDYASLYLTPGVRLKFNPKGRIQPYAAMGGGYSLYEHSTLNAGGTANIAPRHKSSGVFDYGGGVDVPVKKWLALRGEVRDFYTPNPVYNIFGVNGSRQHNVVLGGGFVLRFGN